MSAPYDVVLLGASFAGLELLHQLRRKGLWRRYPRAKIAVVDQVDRNPYIPLVHEGLTQPTLAPASVHHAKVAKIHPQIEFIQAKVTRVQVRTGQVWLEDGACLCAPRLVIALGSQICVPARLDPHGRCHALKSAAQRQALFSALRQTPAPTSIVVAGGGLSGVELAAELAYGGGDGLGVRLVHSGERLVPHLGRSASKLSLARLVSLGVTVQLCTKLQKVGATTATLVEADKAPVEIPADLVCWAAGVCPPAGLKLDGCLRDRAGWLRVDPTMRLWCSDSAQVHPQRYAMGDLASVCLAPDDTPRPTMRRAIESIWQGKLVAAQILARWEHADRNIAPTHRLVPTWPSGISLGPSSVVTYGALAVDLYGVGRWFRRWLKTMYLRRYKL